MKTLLLLGGTADARRITKALTEMSAEAGTPLRIIYSIAGLVRMPDVPCEVISGGFTQFGGLEAYVRAQGVDAILDVTHPFADTMSSHAVAVAKLCGIPCWRFHRPVWQQQSGDRWQVFDSWTSLIPALAAKHAVLLTAGQLTQSSMDQLVAQSLCVRGGQRLVLRTAVPPKVELPDTVQWIKAIGPFKQADEHALMEQYGIDALVTKNSGGAATEAKLHAARELGIDVYMLQRPELPPADRQLSETAEGVAVIKDWLRR